MFKLKTGMKVHMRDVHVETKDWHCDVCGKAFKTNYVLKMHKEIHENKRRWKCNICGKEFNCSDSVVHHKKTHERPGIIQ